MGACSFRVLYLEDHTRDALQTSLHTLTAADTAPSRTNCTPTMSDYVNKLRTSKRKRAQVNYYEESVSEEEDVNFPGEEEHEEIGERSRAKVR